MTARQGRPRGAPGAQSSSSLGTCDLRVGRVQHQVLDWTSHSRPAYHRGTISSDSACTIEDTRHVGRLQPSRHYEQRWRCLRYAAACRFAACREARASLSMDTASSSVQ